MRRRAAACLAPLLALIASLAPAGVGELLGQEPSGSELAARIDALASEALRQGPLAGVSIVVVHHGRTLVEKGYGFANLEHQVPATAETVYHIDSITKYLTAAAILQFVEHGKLSLEDEISKYVPDFPTPGRRVTIRQLLNHTSGIESYTSLGKRWARLERLDLSHQEVLDMIRGEPFRFDPGQCWRYSNSGFYLLGLVLERLGGSLYPDAMRSALFQPLGMSTSVYGDARPIRKNRAQGYEVEKGKLVNADPISWGPPFAGGGLCSTAKDLARWQQALDTGKVLSAASLAEMGGPTRLPGGVAIDYGLGTRLGELEGHRVYGHTGNGGGYRNTLERFPDDDLTIIVLANTDAGPAGSILASRIARAVLRLPAPVVRDLPLGTGELSAYLGTYESDEGRVVAFEKEGKLRVRPEGEKGEGYPFPYQGNKTFAIGEDAIVRFEFEGGRAVWGLEYDGGLFAGAAILIGPTPPRAK